MDRGSKSESEGDGCDGEENEGGGEEEDQSNGEEKDREEKEAGKKMRTTGTKTMERGSDKEGGRRTRTARARTRDSGEEDESSGEEDESSGEEDEDSQDEDVGIKSFMYRYLSDFYFRSLQVSMISYIDYVVVVVVVVVVDSHFQRIVLCLCLCVFSSHLFWTSSSLDVPAGVTHDFSSTFLLRCMLLFFSREGFSCSFPSSTVKSNLEFCVLTIESFSTSWAFYFYFIFIFLARRNPSYLATEETTATQQVSHRSFKCQSGTWSQRSTKVNGSHHGDNPLFRPTGIQIASKSYATLQAMVPTNVKTVHQTSLLHIENSLNHGFVFWLVWLSLVHYFPLQYRVACSTNVSSVHCRGL